MNFMTPIESPNLPKRGITLAAVSVGAEKAKEYLLSRGISVFDILPCAAITDGTAAHADLHLLHLGGRKIILSREQCNNAEKLIEMGFDVQVLDTPLGDKYPADVPLNAALFGNYAILNPKTVCKNIDFSGRSLIPVRQGYTKCSVVPVTENAIITDDVSIASASQKSGLAVLLVSKGRRKNQSLSLFVRRACGGGRGLSINRYRLNTSARREISRKSFWKLHFIPKSDFYYLPLCYHISENFSGVITTKK